MKIGQTIYLDHQATTPLDSQVLQIMQPYLADGFGNPHATEHAVGWRTAQAVEEAARSVGSMIGSDPDEIIFTSGATEANNLALLGLARRSSGGTRKRVLLGATEHKCVLAIGRILEEQLGFAVEHIAVDREGRIDLAALESLLDEDVLVVSVMAANNEIGTLQDIDAISRLAKRFGSILHCDAAQAPCAMDISEFAQLADLISLSAHKMYGPLGVGALYIRRDLQSRIEPIIYGGGQQNGLRSGTLPTALCVGMGAAAKLITGEGAKSERERLGGLRDLFISRVRELPCEVTLNGPEDPSYRHPSNANLRFIGVDARDLLSRIQPNLAASTGSACTSGIPEPSHVLGAIGLSPEEAESSVRFSLGRQTTMQDIDDALAILSEALADITSAGLLEIA
ncbi:cysteine desulfurase [Ruegeria pomeroyi]|nr:cysteine desulfurase [Ruegeria pomeroyi]